MIHTVKGFGIVNKAEIDVFLELSCFFHETKIMASAPITARQIEGEKVEVVTDFLLGSKITVDVSVAMKSEYDCFLAGKR